MILTPQSLGSATLMALSTALDRVVSAGWDEPTSDLSAQIEAELFRRGESRFCSYHLKALESPGLCPDCPSDAEVIL